MTLPLPADKRMMSFERLMGVVITFYRANPKDSPKQMDISRDEVAVQSHSSERFDY